MGCVNGQIIQVAAALGKEGEPPEQTATPWPTCTRLVPPSPTPRAVINTPIGSSNIDNIIDQGTLTIGWIGPGLFAILIAAFAWGTRVFEWLGTLATWLFSGEWRGGGMCESAPALATSLPQGRHDAWGQVGIHVNTGEKLFLVHPMPPRIRSCWTF